MMLGKNKGSDETCKRIPKNSIGVELGVWKGDSSEKFLKMAKHIHLVDPWKVEAYEESDEFGDYEGYLKRYSILVGSTNPKDFQRYYDKIYESVQKRFRNKPVTIHRCTTKEFFESFTDPVNWIYVDALHSFDGCLEDLEHSLKIIKPGGSIFGDDYGDAKPGVKKAVNTFVANHKSISFFNFHADQYEIKV